jgi:hypothetical protein
LADSIGLSDLGRGQHSASQMPDDEMLGSRPEKSIEIDITLIVPFLSRPEVTHRYP